MVEREWAFGVSDLCVNPGLADPPTLIQLSSAFTSV